MTQKLNKRLTYRPGIFNNKNEMILAKALQMTMDKVDELIDEVESLKEELQDAKEKIRAQGH